MGGGPRAGAGALEVLGASSWYDGARSRDRRQGVSIEVNKA